MYLREIYGNSAVVELRNDCVAWKAGFGFLMVEPLRKKAVCEAVSFLITICDYYELLDTGPRKNIVQGIKLENVCVRIRSSYHPAWITAARHFAFGCGGTTPPKR